MGTFDLLRKRDASIVDRLLKCRDAIMTWHGPDCYLASPALQEELDRTLDAAIAELTWVTVNGGDLDETTILTLADAVKDDSDNHEIIANVLDQFTHKPVAIIGGGAAPAITFKRVME